MTTNESQLVPVFPVGSRVSLWAAWCSDEKRPVGCVTTQSINSWREEGWTTRETNSLTFSRLSRSGFASSGFLVVDHRPRPQEEEEEEESGCMSVLLQLSSLNGLSGGEDKHQDASRLEPPTRLLCLGVSSHFLFGHFGDF